MSSKTKIHDYNSSKTRVAPAFSKIMKNPGPFFELLSHECNIDCSPSTKIRTIMFAGKSSKEPCEKQLPPRPEYLKELLMNFSQNTYLSKLKGNTDATSLRRLALANKKTCATELNKALELIDKLDLGKSPNAWYVLEGSTKPDVFIETDTFILVVEGKRTEHGPEIGTTWDPKRHQMIRHIEGALQYASCHSANNPKSVYAIYIVEESSLDKYNWNMYAAQDNKPYIDSLPHLYKKSPEKFSEVKKAFKGTLTWQQLWSAYKDTDDPIRYIKSIEYYAPHEQPPCD